MESAQCGTLDKSFVRIGIESLFLTIRSGCLIAIGGDVGPSNCSVFCSLDFCAAPMVASTAFIIVRSDQRDVQSSFGIFLNILKPFSPQLR